MRIRFSALTVFGLSLVLAASTVFATPTLQRKPVHMLENSLQVAIDKAAPGEVVRVPAGVHTGNFTLSEGVILMGEGAGKSILDGQGRGIVVRGAKNAIVTGLTIRNGAIGIQNDSNYMGVFHNEIVDNRHMGLHIVGGSSVIMNNLIARNRGMAGIGCNSSFPYIANNTIIENGVHGVWAWFPTGPTMVNNLVSGNRIGVTVGSGAEVKSISNNFWGNVQTEVHGMEVSETDMSIAPKFTDVVNGDIRLSADSPLLAAGTPVLGGNSTVVGVDFGSKLALQDYQALMGRILGDVVEDQPMVRYDLSDELGLFYVHIQSPVATFQIRSSTKDTEIRDYDAWDGKTNEGLYSEYVYKDFPTIIVNNRSFETVETDRYQLESVYYHPASYGTDYKGHKVFQRETTFSRMEVLAPQGFIPVVVNNANPSFSVVDGRVLISVNDIGKTELQMVFAEISPMVMDVYGVLGLPGLDH